MKYFFALLLVGLILVSGCTQNDAEANKSSQKSNESAGQSTDTKIGKPIGKIIQTDQVTDISSHPSISVITGPSNPSLEQKFSLTVSADDDVGLKQISWKFLGQEGSFDCASQKTCSNKWELTASEQGEHKIDITITESSGRESPSSSTVSVGEFREIKPEPEEEEKAYSFTCGNSVCEGGESYLNCGNDCEASKTVGTRQNDGACEPGESVDNSPKDCETINPKCGNNVCDSGETRTTCLADCEEETTTDNSCSTNSDCGYKQRCRSGKCQSVECTNDAQCGSNKRCSDNVCRTNYY